MTVSIKVDGVWKGYSAYKAIGLKAATVGRQRRLGVDYSRKWALQDINFEVEVGKSFGIVGHNGSGKSTLLSLLFGTIFCDQGSIVTFGNIGGMLELGAGCNLELTGRENIFMSAAILGMRISEVNRAFDSIVDFSELGSAIDLPLRTYSQGMSARLAFSVLAHARRDILLIDEVLSVGDLGFQEKCLQYLGDYTSSGGTLIVVSHDLLAVERLCSDGIMLHEGRVTAAGSMSSVIRTYRGAFIGERN